MAHGHSLTSHQMLCILTSFLRQTRSRLTFISVIVCYVLMYCVILWFLFSSPCQTWWWPYRKKRAETCCLSFDSLQLNKVLLCFDYPTLYHCDMVIAHNGDEPPKDVDLCVSIPCSSLVPYTKLFQYYYTVESIFNSILYMLYEILLITITQHC